MKSAFRTTVLALTFVFFLSFTFAQKPTTAVELNNYLADITDSLYLGGQNWGTTMVKAKETKNFSSLAASRRTLENFIERKRVDVLTLKDINGSEKLRLAMLDLLFIESKMIKEAFLPFEKFNKQTTDADFDRAIAYLQEKADEETLYLDEVVGHRTLMAEKMGLRLRKGNN